MVTAASLVAPAADQKAGGDFQVIERVGSLTLVFVGDVAGHGEAAAPYAERAAAAVRRQFEDRCDPAVLLERLNRECFEDPQFDRFVSACALVIDDERRSATWAFAGHLPPHWLDTGIPVDGARPGLPLGAALRWEATSAEKRPLRRGEGFVLYTDGVEDVRDARGFRFGSARVTHALATVLCGMTPQEVVDGLKRAACEFGGRELEDDVCIVALRLD